jgi:hypothetical protein
MSAVNQKLTHVLQNRIVAKARQEDKTLYLDFTDGSTLEIRLEDPASSVIVRGSGGDLQYAD